MLLDRVHSVRLRRRQAAEPEGDASMMTLGEPETGYQVVLISGNEGPSGGERAGAGEEGIACCPSWGRCEEEWRGAYVCVLCVCAGGGGGGGGN